MSDKDNDLSQDSVEYKRWKAGVKNEGEEIRLSPAKKVVLELERQKKKLIEEK